MRDINKKRDIIMLKFQNNNTSTIATFEDSILTAFVIIDELYFRYVPDAVSKEGMF